MEGSGEQRARESGSCELAGSLSSCGEIRVSGERRERRERRELKSFPVAAMACRGGEEKVGRARGRGRGDGTARGGQRHCRAWSPEASDGCPGGAPATSEIGRESALRQ